VTYAGYDESGYGFYVRTQHNGTYSTLYGHCSVLNVKTGQTVKQGQKIAEVGSTGHSTGPHLHFEVIKNGVRVDALNYFK
jgi:murein DD-endopeptidase MepM/ murein hydrolase activator NlpD